MEKKGGRPIDLTLYRTRFPFSRLARVCFDNGFLITNDLAVQAEVERHHEFGRFIFPLSLDLSGPIIEDEKE